MDRVWSSDHPVAVRDVLAELLPVRALAYTTVMTVMDNLHRKGLLARERDGRAYRYRATIGREEHTASLMEEALAASLDRQATLLHFVEQMSPEEVSRLRQALEAHVPEARPGDER